MWLLSVAVSIVAYFVALLVRVLLRGLTMAVSHRFPAAPLGDVETYTALWCLAHAQAIYDLCFSTANDTTGCVNQHSASLGSKTLGSEPRASSGDSITNSARSTPHGHTLRALPVDIAENLQLFPRGPTGSAGVSPEAGGMAFPGGPIRRQGVLFFVRCRESTRSADSWPTGDGTQPRTSDLPLPAIQLLTDVSEMDLAVLTIDPPHGSSGQPNIDASVDTVVGGVRALLDYCSKRDGCGAAAGSGTSLASTPTTNGLRFPSFASKSLAQMPPRVVLGGSGFGATVAMLALIRRYIALNHCEGLLLIDPFVGWAGSAHNRKVSFIDNSLASVSSDGGSAAASPSASFHYPHAVSPGATPKRSALPSATAGKANNAQSPRLGRSSRSPVQKKGGGLSGLLWDFVHDLCAEVKMRVRKELSKRPLRQWFPATQWSANGSDTPVCMVLDATSVWIDDQLEFAAKWQSTGDDLECHVWCGDRTAAGCTLPQSAAALKQSLKRPPRVPSSVPQQAFVGLGPASPVPTPRTPADTPAGQHSSSLALGDTVAAGARWLAAIRGVPSTPEVSMMMSTPHFEAATRAWNAPQHLHPNLGAPANGPSWSSYQGLPASATHLQMPTPAGAGTRGVGVGGGRVAAQPVPVPVAALHGSLPAPHVRVAKRGVREDGHSLVSTVGESPGNVSGGTHPDPDNPRPHGIAGFASAPSADSISELLRDHPHSM